MQRTSRDGRGGLCWYKGFQCSSNDEQCEREGKVLKWAGGRVVRRANQRHSRTGGYSQARTGVSGTGGQGQQGARALQMRRGVNAHTWEATNKGDGRRGWLGGGVGVSPKNGCTSLVTRPLPGHRPCAPQKDSMGCRGSGATLLTLAPPAALPMPTCGSDAAGWLSGKAPTLLRAKHATPVGLPPSACTLVSSSRRRCSMACMAWYAGPWAGIRNPGRLAGAGAEAVDCCLRSLVAAAA